MSDLRQPLNVLLSVKNTWVWGPEQKRAFSLVKEELALPIVLALYNPKANAKISADTSSFGLRAVLLQRCGDAWKPVAYASRSINDETARWYAQIEKEALATIWYCDILSICAGTFFFQ